MATPAQIALLDDYEAAVVESQKAADALAIAREQLRLAEEVARTVELRLWGARSCLDHAVGYPVKTVVSVMTNVETFSAPRYSSFPLPSVPLFESGLTVADLLTPVKK